MCERTEFFEGISDSRLLAERNIHTVCYTLTDSTSAAARRYAAEGGAAPALFVADGQTHGRGRLDRSFFSPSNTGIYMTLLFDITDEPPMSFVSMTSAAAVAVAGVCEERTGRRCLIKWVNDIYADGKKVCGILAEGFSVGQRRYAMLGVGVNLDTQSFPDELTDIAGSLGAQFSHALRRTVTAELAAALYDVHQSIRRGDMSHMDEYRRRSAVLGKEIRFCQNGEWKSGVALSVDDIGALTVALPDGTTQILSSGEISLKLK